MQVVTDTPPEVVQAWQRAVAELHERFRTSFAQWFSSVQFESLEHGVLRLSARDEFVRNWVRDHFQVELVETLEQTLGERVTVDWGVRANIERPIYPSGGWPTFHTSGGPLDGSPEADAREPDDEETTVDSAVRRPRRLRLPDGSRLLDGAGSFDGTRVGDGTRRTEPPPTGSVPPRSASSPGVPSPGVLSPSVSSPGVSSPSGGHGSSTGNGSSGRANGNGSAHPQALVFRTRRDQLNPKYTFDNFVVGPSNELAHAAAIAAGGGGGPRYNPLFICGGTGLGKTHLMHSIAHYVLDKRRDACVLYVSAERFTNQFIEALLHHKMEAFRHRYRSECDVLLVDDIQFLTGREQTLEEFFHTFNALHEADKPIVVSSDKYPQDLHRMPERLISRFASGLVADIQTPALETRVAIVRKKASLEGIQLHDDVAVFLAQNVRSNVRELEGTLIRLAAKSSLVGRPIDLDFAQGELRLVSPARPDVRSVEDIQRAVCGHFRLTNAELLSKDRHKSVAFARQVAMYLCRQRLKCSFPELGRAFGNRDHTTVMSAVRRVEALREKDPQVKAHLDAIEDTLAKRDD